MLDFILQDITIREYPVPTIIHWLQGLLVGFLLIQGHNKRNWHLTAYGIVAAICFLVYEALEQGRIADKGDVDVLNFTFMVHVSALGTMLYNRIILRRSKKDVRIKQERDFSTDR